MSVNSKKLDRLLKKGGAIADAIREHVPKASLSAHRRGAVPTLNWLLFYSYLVDYPLRDWLSGVDLRRGKKRIDAAKRMVRPALTTEQLAAEVMTTRFLEDRESR